MSNEVGRPENPLNALANTECAACHGEAEPLSLEERRQVLADLGPAWSVSDGHKLHRSFRFHDFQSALAFVNTCGQLAEALGHHPDLLLRWGEVQAFIWTHAIDNLTDADAVLAAQIERAYRKRENS